ncbi:MAG: TonB-dependent siderophore receptor [Synoicihabitans sp.]
MNGMFGPLAERLNLRSSTRLIRTTSAVVLFSCAAHLRAQDENEDVITLDPFDVTSVETDGYLASNSISGTAMNTLLKDIPMTINVITSEFLDDAIVGDLERALDFNSSVTQTTRGQINNQNSIYSLRGFRNRNVLLDGVMGGDHLPRYLVDRIEVVKGPNTLYGQSDPGGLVNMISKRPRSQDRTVVTTRFGSENTIGADFDMNIAQIAPNLGLRLLGSWEDTDGWRWTDAKDSTFFAGSAEWKVTDATKIRLIASTANKGGMPTNRATYSFMRVPTDLNGDGDTDDRVGGVVEATARYNNDFLPWEWTSETEQASEFNQNHQYAQLNVIHEVNDMLNLQYSYTKSYRETQVTFREYNTFSPAKSVTAAYNTGAFENETDAHTLNAFITGETGGIKHNLIAGARYTDDRRYSEGFRLRPGNGGERVILDWLEAQTGKSFRHTVTKDEILAGAQLWLDDAPTTSELRSYGPRTNQNADAYTEVTTLFVSDSMLMMDDRLRLLAGLRNIEIVGYSFQLDGSGGDKRTSKDTSYQFGANYSVNDSLVLFTNTATAFNPNGFNSDTNEFFPPEESEAYEFGAKLDGLFDGRLSGSIAWFQIDKENVVRSDFNPVTFMSDREITDDRSEGIDLELFLNASEGWQITLGYTHLNARTVVSQTEALGLNLEGAAPDKLTFYTTYSFADDSGLKGLRIGGGGIKAWGPIQQFGTSGNRLVVEDGYTQINVFARYRTELFNRPTTFGLNISNLADEFFIRARANTGTPRQVMGSIRMEF